MSISNVVTHSPKLVVGDSSCYDRLTAKYPGMDSNARSIVRILCDNQQTGIDTGPSINFSNQGINAIGEALQQNTALKSFHISTVYCLDPDSDCISTLANVFSSALKINRSLKEFVVSLSDVLPTQTFLHNLPCYNLNSLALQHSSMIVDGARDFANTMQNNPYFPLTNFSWLVVGGGGSNLDPATMSLIQAGLSKSRCIDSLDLSLNSYTTEQIANLFQVTIGNSKLGSINVPYDIDPRSGNYLPFTQDQKNRILNAIAQNSCFLNYMESSGPAQSFPLDLAGAIKNITQGRTPCSADPLCSLSLTCATPNPPTPAPTPGSDGYSGMSVTTALAIAVPVTAAVSIALTLLAKYGYHKLCPPDPLTQRLI